MNTSSKEQTQAIGKRLGETIEDPCIITLTGDVGAGKTEFTKGFTCGAGSDIATSPTFAIMNVYEGGKLPLFHFDFYRLGEGADLFEFEEYLYGDGIAIVEWSQLTEIEGDRIDVDIKKTGENEREITLTAHGKMAEKWLERAGL